MSEKPITNDDCIKWKKNKSVNPHTDYNITEKSKIYKRLKKACVDVQTPKKSPINAVKLPNQKIPITPELCYKWLNNNKKKNPITNALIKPSIKKNSIYKQIEDACIKLKIIDAKTKEPIIPKESFMDIKVKPKEIDVKEIKNPKYKTKQEISKEDCIKWNENKLLNPLTKNGKQKIKENGPIYKQFQKDCAKFNLPFKEIKEKSPSILSVKLPKKTNEVIQKKIKEVKIPEFKKEVIIKTTDEYKDLYYPDLDDINFNKKLLSLKEIRVHKINDYPDIKTIEDFEKKASELCSGFDKSSFQYLMAHYLSYRTPYRSLLLYYSVGVGKTCTAITIAESLLVNHNTFEESKIWVVLPGAIEAGFKNQIFDSMRMIDFSTISNQCTGDTYVKLSQISKETDMKTVEKKIKKLIKSRYSFFTYEGFANFIEKNYKEKERIIKDKVIIVDEAHNIRSTNNGTDEDDENKRVYDALISVCQTGVNNRLIFLTATPMYNEPTDIYDLFYLLLLNDKRLHLYDKNLKIFDSNNNLKESSKEFISLMASNYISYLRGKNPFNFALKLSPALSGIPILESPIPLKDNGEPIDNNDKDWISNIDNGIVLSKLGKKQIEYMKVKQQLEEEKGQHNNFDSQQPMNIVYDSSVGKEGFNNFFIREGQGEQVIVKYTSKYNNALVPDDNNLGIYSGKFLNIINIIKKAKGIVVIYSKFKWAGVVPLAIALEHLGFTREGTQNILLNPYISEKVVYDGIKTPKYAILSSSDPEVMGNTTIDGLMTKINNPANINGELVKVVLMTPVAGEGLNFQNIREIHITDPWYHFNKIDQIIGRGIRNCSHKKLPIKDRNVTVYMHCSFNNMQKETYDINIYRIASRKLYQSFIVDEVIRNSAIDCSLFKSINFFPKSMFKLGDIDITTSQGKTIKYTLGDDDKFKPNCKIDLETVKENSNGFREETYKHLAINIQSKLKKFILESIHKNKRFISFQELKDTFNYVDIKILMHSIKISIYPNLLIDDIIILPHQDGIHIIDIIKDNPLRLQLITNTEDETPQTIEIKSDFYDKIRGLDKDNYYNAIIALYLSLDEITFKNLIDKIFKSKSLTLNKIDSFIEQCFIKEGVLIKPEEIPSIPTTEKYLGFINIFNEDFEPLLYNYDNNTNHKSLNQKQLTQLKSNRIFIQKPDDFMKEIKPWGLIIPSFIDKDKKNKINAFKLITPDVIYGKKTGIMCSSLKKSEHLTIFQQLNLNAFEDKKNTKFTYCNKIAIELYKINRITIYPEYKPKNK